MNLSSSFFFSIAAVLLAITWALFPNLNLEPLIVLILVLVPMPSLIKQDLVPWLELRKMEKNNYEVITSSHKINALEISAEELFKIGSVEFELISQKFSHYPSKLDIFFEQTDYKFQARFDNGFSNRLKSCFSIGYLDDPEVKFPKNSNQYIVAQFDIDGDGIDELLIAVIDKEDQFLHDVQLTIYKYHPPLLESDIKRQQNWERVETIEAYSVVSTVKIIVDRQSITIPRNHRGFYYKWRLVDGKMIDMGDY